MFGTRKVLRNVDNLDLIETYNPTEDRKISLLFRKLDMLSWTFRIEKSSERGCEPQWKVVFINPKNKTWYESSSVSLCEALSEAVEILIAV